MRALVHVVPRAGAQASAERFDSQVERLRERAARQGMLLTRLHALEEDPLRRNAAYRETLEIRGAGVSRDSAAWLFSGLGEKLEPIAHPDLCTLLLGEDIVFVPSERAPIRYQYLMRRNARFSHETYLTRTREVHSRFGRKTPGILGYVQLHVDPAASRFAAHAAGLGAWGYDSVSELHLASLESFLAAVAESDIGAQAVADEDLFVDRAHSQGFTSKIEKDRNRGRS